MAFSMAGERLLSGPADTDHGREHARASHSCFAPSDEDINESSRHLWVGLPWAGGFGDHDIKIRIITMLAKEWARDHRMAEPVLCEGPPCSAQS